MLPLKQVSTYMDTDIAKMEVHGVSMGSHFITSSSVVEEKIASRKESEA